MTELERVLLAKLEQIEQRHEQQTEDLRQQLQQQAHSLSALQKGVVSWNRRNFRHPSPLAIGTLWVCGFYGLRVEVSG